MTSNFPPIHKYAVAVNLFDGNLRFMTQILYDAGTPKYKYQAAAYGDLDDVCTVDSLDQLVLMLDDIDSASTIYGSAGETLDNYEIVPVTVTVSTEDCTKQIQEANFSIKRVKALAKLTNEDKLVLGITD